jgi:excisionase family DNA binding protein
MARKPAVQQLTGFTSLSSLAELLEHPERANDLPPHAARDLLPRIIGLQVAVLARALVNGHDANSEDRLLTVDEAAARLGLSKDWLYRHATKVPFTRRVGRQLRFSSQGLESYIRKLPR